MEPSMINDESGVVDRERIEQYLDLIYPAEYGWAGHISASHSLPDGTGMPSTSWDRPTAATGLQGFATVAAQRGAPGTYLRCTTVSPDVPRGRRGGAEQSIELPGLWADIDIAGPGHKHDPSRHEGRPLPETVDAAHGIIAASGLLRPSVIVHSGGGLYAWWLFDRPVRVDEEQSRQWWAEVSKYWQQQLLKGAVSMGLHYGTGVGNLDRVLGVVGTMNAKIPGAERMRVVLSSTEYRYSPEDISAYATGPSANVGGVPSEPSQPRTDGDAGFALPSATKDPEHLSPLDDFELRHSWGEVLLPQGWECVTGDASLGGYCEWRRPGASHPISATTGRESDRDRMFVFSDASGLPSNEPLTKGYVYAQLYHGGDMSVAARAVQQLGYGSTSARQGAAGAAGPEGQGAQGRRLELTPASSMRARATRWLWADEAAGAQWLPLGGIALLGGREGRGKTTWTYRIIAELTRGTLPGDLCGSPKSAVIAATEDDWEATIVPRLMSAGADLDRVYRIDVVEPDSRTGVSLPEDLTALGALLATRDDIALLVLDPIITVLSARADSHKDHEVRKALEPLARIAHGAGVTVLGLIHDNKSSGNDLSTRLMGSRAFVAVARAALVCLEEGEEPEEGQADALGADPVGLGDGVSLETPSASGGTTYLLGQVKSNLGPRAPWSIRYRIASRVVAHDEEVGKDITGSYIVRTGRRTELLEDTARRIERGHDPSPAKDAVRRALLAELRGGQERASRAVKDRLIEDGHSLATIKRAARELVVSGEVKSVKRGKETYWSLPSDVSGSSPTPTPPYPPHEPYGTDGTYGPGEPGEPRPFVEGEGGFSEGTRLTAHRSPLPARASHVEPRPCSCRDGLHVPWCPNYGEGIA